MFHHFHLLLDAIVGIAAWMSNDGDLIDLVIIRKLSDKLFFLSHKWPVVSGWGCLINLLAFPINLDSLIVG